MTGLLTSFTTHQSADAELTPLSSEFGGCLHERFEQQVERTPDAVALVCEGESLTYAQLNRRANCLAHRLRELGVVSPDQLVGLHTERGIEMVVGIIGILKAGGAYLPLDPVYPRDRVAFMLEDSGVRVVVTQESLIASLEGTPATRVLLGELLSGPDNNPVPVATADNLAYVIYTSGSTGKPKGALITHHNVTRLFDATEAWYHFDEQDVWTLFHSYAFDFSVWELWGALLYGGRVVVVPYWISRSPDGFRELLVREGVTVLNQTPSAFRQLIQAELAQPKADLALRYVIFGGEALELQSLRPWFERYGDERPLLVNMYGITETTVHVTYRPIRLTDLHSGQGSVIGAPIPDLQLYILEPDGAPAPVGVPGEMYVGGAGVARGYLNRAELTAQRFIADPFASASGARLYRTGDLARRLENGDIEYLGRVDHQVKIRGFRIELGEIEAGIATHPAIREVVVIAREDVPGDKRLVAYVVAVNAPTELVDQLRELLRASLPEYMVPAHFVRLDALPLTENGKVDRNALPAPERAAPDATYVAPRTRTEETLSVIWAEVLGLERVGIRDNFFELGGHSLLVINVLEKMRRAELHVDVRAIFLTPTIAELAVEVAETSGDVEVPPNLIPEDCERISPEMLTLVQLSPAEVDAVVATVPGGAPNIQDIYPLSPLQEGILFHHRMVSKGDPYLVTTVFGSNSRELLDRYLQGLRLVIDRHDILRTAFLWEGLSEPVQVVCRQAPLVVEELNLDPANGDIAEQLQERFDPTHYRLDVREAPIIRIFIAHDEAKSRWVMLRTHHHLLEDHTTDELMSEEILLCLQGQAHQLPPALPFRNFVAQTRLGVDEEEHKAFFRNMLADVDEPTVPFGLNDVTGDGSDIAEARTALDSVLASQLRETAHKHGVSAASLFHLAWAKVLSQCSGRDDVVFGTVLFGRMHAGQGAERVLGPFINTLPLRLQLGDTSVKDGIRQTHARMAQLLGHEHASLAVAQNCSAVAATVPLFSALLNFRHLKITGQIPENSNHAMAVAVGRMGLELLKFEERTNYPLELSVDDLGDGFILEAQARSPIDPRRICEYMRTALEQLVVALETSPTSTLRSLNVLPHTERQQLVVEWNATTRDYGDQWRLHHLIEKQVARTPDAIALEFDGQELTYAELNRRANQLARLLRQRGVGPDVLVGIFAERSFEMVLSLLAVLKAGGAYVPLDPSYPAERLGHMLEDARAPVVLTQPHLAEKLPAAVGELLLLDPSWAAYAGEAGEDLDDVGTPRDLAYVIFTSGSTGRPKGAMNEHRGICNRLQWMQEEYGLTGNDRVLQKTPFSFDVSVWEFFWPLLAGARLVIARPEGHRDSAYLVELIRQSRITTLHFVPSMLRMFLELEDVEACTSLKRVICSGEALPHELQERFFARLPGAELHNLYGPTEAAVDVTYWACRRGDERLTVPIGRPVANTQVYVLDARMEPVPVGVAGELYIGGVQVGRGYVGRADLTAERFVPDPFSRTPGARLYKTGDLARHLPDGAIEYLGRTDFQVKIRGQRIELGEIEATLDQHAGVAQSVVMMREDNPGDQRLAAYVVPRQADLSVKELKELLSKQMPSYMVPSAFVLLDAMPLTSSGKVDRKRLPAPEHSDVHQTAYVAPRTPTEEVLAEIWTNVLGLERVGIRDNFFELGGHSLLAVSVIERMRQAELKVNVGSLFLMPTIAELATAVAAESDDIEVPSNRIPPGCKAITPDMLPLVQLTAEEIERVVTAVPGGAANILDIYPLAPLQEGFLFHHLLTTEGDLYIMETQFSFDSRDRLDRYLKALQWVVDRHDIQRTAFLWKGLREPVQVVCRKAPLIVEELSLNPADGDVAQQLSARFNLLNYRIDLSVPPMIRIFVAHDPSNDRWIYHQLTHHLMDDQASVNMQEEELQAFLQGQADKLLAPRPFRNFVARARLGVPLREHEAFFRNMLADVDEPTAPFEFADVLGNGSRIDEGRSFVDPELARRLHERGRELGVSTAALFHLAWAMVLSKCSDRDDVVFGTVLLGRTQGREGAGPVLGPCINTLPMRISVGDISVQEGVRQTHTLLAQILRHEHAPLGLTQRCSAVGMDIPLFSSILNYRRPSRGLGRGRHGKGASDAQAMNKWIAKSPTVIEWFSEAIEGREFIRFLERTNYPLTLSVDDFGDGFRLVAQVQSPIDPQRICSYVHTALEQLVGALEMSPNVPMRGLQVLPDAERHELLVDWNRTTREYPRNALMQEWFEAQSARAPGRTAVKDGSTVLSYKELDTRANRVAQALRARGVGRGQRVGLCVERGADMLAAVLGILKAGAAYVPLDPSFPAERLRFMAEDAQLALLVSTSALTAPFGVARERQVLLDADAGSIASQPDQRPSPDAALEARPEDPAYVIYTSGSTGKPKGVVVPHRAVVNFLASMAREPGLSADDVLVAVTTLSFDIAVLELQLPLTLGATVVIASREEAVDGQALGALLERHRASVMQATPVTWRLLIEAGWKGGKDFKALVGGEALPRDLAEQLLARGVELWNLYGPTETTVWSTCARITDTSHGISIGKPIANTRVYILDAHNNPCPIGIPGELCIGGDGVTLGYWRRPELTAERFIPDPFSATPGATLYRTGDRARWRTDGTLEHLGRLDFQVKLRGYRIELGEIEVALARHPAIREAVVMVREDVPGDPRLVAYLVAENPSAELADQLRAQLRAGLPEYMVPSAFVTLEALPLTANGKIDRKALPAPECSAMLQIDYVAPRTPTEEILVGIWAEVLGLDRVGIEQNFFELGGHSLLAMQVVSRVRQALSVELPLRELFAAPTISGLAARTERLRAESQMEAKIDETPLKASSGQPAGLTGDREETVV
jgi:amino acid adenylation domain-containing protein